MDLITNQEPNFKKEEIAILLRDGLGQLHGHIG
jgi:hypothetical protein